MTDNWAGDEVRQVPRNSEWLPGLYQFTYVDVANVALDGREPRMAVEALSEMVHHAAVALDRRHLETSIEECLCELSGPGPDLHHP